MFKNFKIYIWFGSERVYEICCTDAFKLYRQYYAIYLLKFLGSQVTSVVITLIY